MKYWLCLHFFCLTLSIIRSMFAFFFIVAVVSKLTVTVVVRTVLRLDFERHRTAHGLLLLWLLLLRAAGRRRWRATWRRRWWATRGRRWWATWRRRWRTTRWRRWRTLLWLLLMFLTTARIHLVGRMSTSVALARILELLTAVVLGRRHRRHLARFPARIARIAAGVVRRPQPRRLSRRRLTRIARRGRLAATFRRTRIKLLTLVVLTGWWSLVGARISTGRTRIGRNLWTWHRRCLALHTARLLRRHDELSRLWTGTRARTGTRTRRPRWLGLGFDGALTMYFLWGARIVVARIFLLRLITSGGSETLFARIRHLVSADLRVLVRSLVPGPTTVVERHGGGGVWHVVRDCYFISLDERCSPG